MTPRRTYALTLTAAAVLTASACSSSPSDNTASQTIVVTSTAGPGAASKSAASTVPAPAKTTAAAIDNPALDLPGSGSDCVMTYAPSPAGGTLTVITVTVPGEIRTHVSDGAGNLHTNDTHITQGPNAFTYDVPLSQVDDMGAVFYPDGGASQSCTIEPAK